MKCVTARSLLLQMHLEGLWETEEKRYFFDDVEHWQACKIIANAGGRPNLTEEEKRRLYLVRSRLSTVYFLEAPGCGVVKIGKTSDLKKRLTALNTMSPVKLNLLLDLEYDEEFETRIHQHLQAFRSHGEWFYACNEVKKFIRGCAEGGLRWAIEQVGDAHIGWMNNQNYVPKGVAYFPILEKLS